MLWIEKFQENAGFSLLSWCHGSSFTARLSLLFYFFSQLVLHSTNPCTFPLLSEFFAIFRKRTFHVCLRQGRIVVLCPRVLMKNKHHQVILPRIQSLDSDAVTHLFQLLLRDLICQICKAQETTYYFKILHHLEASSLFFSLPFSCTLCLSQKISKLPWNYH